MTKFNPAGSALVYSTFIGGSDFDSVSGVVLDPAGNAWLAGSTSSADFPVTAGAPDATFNGGRRRLHRRARTRTGSALLFATFLGGSQRRGRSRHRPRPTGDIYVTGLTFSQDFPATVGAFDRVWNGDLLIFWGDAFVTKLDIDATSSTPIGAARRAGRADAAVAVQRRRRSHSRSRSTGATSPSAVVLHDPDRRLERLHRTAGARARA